MQPQPDGTSLQHEHANHLIDSKSPYLQQHAHNPVDWYPWGDEAFRKARDENKPIFLSIGYSTCHWCHVMAEESFEDLEVARTMNDAFVSVKVDREERPDLDNLYMLVSQAMTGTGGWPLNLILTPDLKPFYAATYIPKESRGGRIGMLELAPRIKERWDQERGAVTDVAERVAAALAQAPQESPGGPLSEAVLERAYGQFADRFDDTYGGFGPPPKFPTPHNLQFLLRFWKRSRRARALDMAAKTLVMMRRGGVYDQLGSGFHRYATDAHWLVPHFEKMLYDQAQIVLTYIDAWQATERTEFRRTAEEVLAYVLRDLTDPAGGFYAGEDADSEGEEGKYYVWTREEVIGALTPEEAEPAIRAFDVQAEGNYRDESVGRKTGRNILHLTRSNEELSQELGLTPERLSERLERVGGKLREARARRVRPHRDRKILTDWNGLMIAALARGAGVFEQPAYAEAAIKAVDFILDRLRDKDGRLLHRYADGESAVRAFAADYAFLVWGLLELYESTFELRHLTTALELSDELRRHYWDHEHGGFFQTADDGERLLVRSKESYDGALPSSNSVAALNLVRLARMTGRMELEADATKLVAAFSGSVSEASSAYTQMLQAVDHMLGPSFEVVIAGDPQADDTRAMLRALRSRFIPNKIVLLRPPGKDPAIVSLAPFVREQLPIDGRATAYVCRDFACNEPTTDPERMLRLLATG